MGSSIFLKPCFTFVSAGGPGRYLGIHVTLLESIRPALPVVWKTGSENSSFFKF